mmetsp:Transcript_46449/g.79145  ORF Transcript_46449/g.79145 Transcript_46449/m.79145 type:complete len:245 (-) Transcript_46449:375-1109(-)
MLVVGSDEREGGNGKFLHPRLVAHRHGAQRAHLPHQVGEVALALAPPPRARQHLCQAARPRAKAHGVCSPPLLVVFLRPLLRWRREASGRGWGWVRLNRHRKHGNLGGGREVWVGECAVKHVEDATFVHEKLVSLRSFQEFEHVVQTCGGHVGVAAAGQAQGVEQEAVRGFCPHVVQHAQQLLQVADFQGLAALCVSQQCAHQSNGVARAQPLHRVRDDLQRPHPELGVPRHVLWVQQEAHRLG